MILTKHTIVNQEPRDCNHKEFYGEASLANLLERERG